ncbi:hypothetical protein F4819DRAFT_486296 [Hypoxylon fuscum]|nr:hypothetical protein F4819DRAFT_486296 [Hypoxylon fuscum]
MIPFQYKRRSRKQWKDLPIEVQNVILKKVVRAVNQSSLPYLSEYACVCRLWQKFFESRIFCRLIIHSSRLYEMKYIVVGNRRKYVRHIALRFELSPLMPRSERDLPENTRNINDYKFTAAVFDFWAVISTWKIHDVKAREPLTLELIPDRPNCSVALYSSYLRDGSFREYQLRADSYRHGAMLSQRPLGDLLDPANYRQLLRETKRSWRKEGDLSIRFQNIPPDQRRLPPVEVVTYFLIRREYDFNFNPTSLSIIFQSLVRLEGINFERGIHLNPVDERYWSLLVLEPKSLSSSLSRSLKNFTFFAEASDVFQTQSAMPLESNELLANEFVNISRGLQHLSLAFLVDAEDFISYAREGIQHKRYHWKHLRSLSLTMKCFVRPDPSWPLPVSRLNGSLVAAGEMAKEMPRLNMMEIWNGDKGQAGIFRYISTSESTTISWQGTKHLQLSTQAIKTWSEVARRNTQHELSLQMLLIPPGWIKGTASVLHYLKIGVMHKVSAWQTQWKQEIKL